MATPPYTTGTITLTNGSAVVTGTGTAWQIALIVGGVIYVQAAGGNPLPILSVDSNTQITAAIEWTGASGEYSYAIQVNNDVNQVLRNAQALSEYIQRLDNPSLSALASLPPEANHVPVFTGPETAALVELGAEFRQAVGINDANGFVPNNQLRILGTVSQASGVPTGSIIERGSNANGEYVRFADGTQICTKSIANAGPINIPNGSAFLSPGPRLLGSWAAAFSAIPNRHASAGSSGDISCFIYATLPPTQTDAGTIHLGRLTGSDVLNFTIQVTGIGRWN
ncbi:hypothetical protein [Rhizobium sp. LC145]|uniref:hypothetical protein n=1 Tax=Rhizobium sp. LC145 TaxID=1120688 RepID=UPI00069B8080|nr:hypothetical protein [Rhizobium sp. LC145]TKT42567.1 hypothetical protein FDR95_28800 [Rhizobiaceae bacterium LC148]